VVQYVCCPRCLNVNISSISKLPVRIPKFLLCSCLLLFYSTTPSALLPMPSRRPRSEMVSPAQELQGNHSPGSRGRTRQSKEGRAMREKGGREVLKHADSEMEGNEKTRGEHPFRKLNKTLYTKPKLYSTSGRPRTTNTASQRNTGKLASERTRMKDILGQYSRVCRAEGRNRTVMCSIT
jgi:hypothetical protein